MAAGTWKVYAKAKKSIGAGTLALNGVFKMALLRKSASATILKTSIGGLSAYASLSTFKISASGLAAGTQKGKSLAGIKWTTGASTKQLKFYHSTPLIWTASGAQIGASAGIGPKYAVIRASTSATGGKLLCFCTLSTTGFVVTSGNTLTITSAATGVFTLA